MNSTSRADPFSAKGLSFDRLRSFCRVVACGSVTEAADGDATRQSQFSRQIKELESALSMRLFDRHNRRMMPTAEGRALALLTQRYFDGVGALCRTAAEAPRLTIAAGESMLEGVILPRFARLRQLYPGHRLHFESGSPARIIEMLQRGEAQVAVLPEEVMAAGDDDLASVFLAEIRQRLVIPRPLLREAANHGWEGLRGLPIAVLRNERSLAATLEKIAGEVGVELLLVAEASTYDALRSLVQTGTVAAFLPEWMARGFPDDRFVRLDDEIYRILAVRLHIVTTPLVQMANPHLEGLIENLASVWRL
jgi:DNA-binding transcriptional LysR family regulator